VATNPIAPTDADRLREIIRLLEGALRECYRHLADFEDARRRCTQDNDPPQG